MPVCIGGIASVFRIGVLVVLHPCLGLFRIGIVVFGNTLEVYWASRIVQLSRGLEVGEGGGGAEAGRCTGG